MAVYYKTQGFVIKKTEQGENNLVFSIFTEDFGKIEIVGKAIRKINSKLRPNIDIFSLCQTEFIQGRRYKTLTDVKSINRFPEIKKNLEKAKIAYKILDSLDNFIIYQEQDLKIWELLKRVFITLNNYQSQNKPEKSKKLEALYHYFILNLFLILGYR